MYICVYACIKRGRYLIVSFQFGTFRFAQIVSISMCCFNNHAETTFLRASTCGCVHSCMHLWQLRFAQCSIWDRSYKDVFLDFRIPWARPGPMGTCWPDQI